MEVIGGLIVAIVLVVAVWGLFGMWKVRSMNYDPCQQELIRLLVSAGQNYQDDPVAATSEINDYFRQRGWDRVEVARRMAHAVSFVEHTPALRPDYENVLLAPAGRREGRRGEQSLVT